MVLFVMKWDIHPDKADAYLEWTSGAIKSALGVPGVVEIRAYRTAVGASQTVATFEFADLAAWAAWSSSDVVQKLLADGHTVALNLKTELWGPSPLVPAPIRPGG